MIELKRITQRVRYLDNDTVMTVQLRFDAREVCGDCESDCIINGWTRINLKGVAFRNPIDRSDLIVGYREAFAHAVDSLRDDVKAEVWRSIAVPTIQHYEKFLRSQKASIDAALEQAAAKYERAKKC